MHTGGMACPGPPRTRDLGPQHTPPPTSSHLLEQGPYEVSVQPGWVLAVSQRIWIQLLCPTTGLRTSTLRELCEAGRPRGPGVGVSLCQSGHPSWGVCGGPVS